MTGLGRRPCAAGSTRRRGRRQGKGRCGRVGVSAPVVSASVGLVGPDSLARPTAGINRHVRTLLPPVGDGLERSECPVAGVAGRGSGRAGAAPAVRLPAASRGYGRCLARDRRPSIGREEHVVVALCACTEKCCGRGQVKPTQHFPSAVARGEAEFAGSSTRGWSFHGANPSADGGTSCSYRAAGEGAVHERVTKPPFVAQIRRRRHLGAGRLLAVPAAASSGS